MWRAHALGWRWILIFLYRTRFPCIINIRQNIRSGLIGGSVSNDRDGQIQTGTSLIDKINFQNVDPCCSILYNLEAFYLQIFFPIRMKIGCASRSSRDQNFENFQKQTPNYQTSVKDIIVISEILLKFVFELRISRVYSDKDIMANWWSRDKNHGYFVWKITFYKVRI